MQLPPLARRCAAIGSKITMCDVVLSLQRQVELVAHRDVQTMPGDFHHRRPLVDNAFETANAYRLRALTAEWTAM